MTDTEEENVPFYVKNFKFILAIIVLIVIYLSYRGYFTATKIDVDKLKNKEEDDDRSESESESDDGDSEKFVVSGGRSDSHGGDHALLDKIHDINERQRRFVKNSGKAKPYSYDARENAAPAVYSPEDELQKELYGM